MQLDVVVAFFLLGIFARVIKAEIHFPKALYQSLSLFLMVAIGLKGGVALAEYAAPGLLTQSFAVILYGFLLPLLAFPLLFWVGQLPRNDAASIAAHYGSVSVGTYAVAIALLESRGIAYEPYFPLFVVLLEMPAIAIGLALAKRGGSGIFNRKVLHEIFCNQGIILMGGALLIGYLFAERTDSIMPLFKGMFHGALALFLLEMGLVAASRLSELRASITFITAFGILMPLLGALTGSSLAYVLGLSAGGIALLAVLGASASYIAVPAAMRVALPDANHAMSITASLGVTFPFNVMVGIPLYISYANWLVN